MRQTVVPREARALAHEVQVLLRKGAIEHVNPQVHPGGFFSIYLLVPKKDGGCCPILDLRHLNRFFKFLQKVTHNRRTAGHHATRLVRDNRLDGRLFSRSHGGPNISVQGAPIWPSLHQFIKAALEPLQRAGMRVLPYDWLICEASPQLALDHAHQLLQYITALGIAVNWRKCKLIPAQSTSFIGLALNSVTMSACLEL